MLQTWMILQELAGPLSALLALVAAVAAMLAAFKSANAARQTNADAHLKIFLKFADEYEKLKVALPVIGDKNPEHVYLAAVSQPKYQLGIFNVCRLFEREHQLHKLGLVPGNIWAIWYADMTELFAHKPVREFVLKNRDQFRTSFISEVVEK